MVVVHFPYRIVDEHVYLLVRGVVWGLMDGGGVGFLTYDNLYLFYPQEHDVYLFLIFSSRYDYIISYE
jgi:hypothetical protein